MNTTAAQELSERLLRGAYEQGWRDGRDAALAACKKRAADNARRWVDAERKAWWPTKAVDVLGERVDEADDCVAAIWALTPPEGQP